MPERSGCLPFRKSKKLHVLSQTKQCAPFFNACFFVLCRYFAMSEYRVSFFFVERCAAGVSASILFKAFGDRISSKLQWMCFGRVSGRCAISTFCADALQSHAERRTQGQEPNGIRPFCEWTKPTQLECKPKVLNKAGTCQEEAKQW